MDRYTAILILVLVATAVGLLVLRRLVNAALGLVWRRRFGRAGTRAAAGAGEPGGRRCGCGYDLRGLILPRCPECGRAVGFDKSFEELGLTPGELKRAGERWGDERVRGDGVNEEGGSRVGWEMEGRHGSG